MFNPIKKFLAWLLHVEPTHQPIVNHTKDRSLSGKARVKARRAAAEQLRRRL